jgi:hypothetical protein
MLRQRKVRFARAGPQTQRGLNSRIRQCKALRRVIASEKVNEIMRFGQSAVGKEERRVSRDSLAPANARPREDCLSDAR